MEHPFPPIGERFRTPIPQVRIKHAWLFEENISPALAQVHFDEEMPAETYDKVEAATDEFRNAWAEKATTILSGMQERSGLQFYEPVITAHIAPYTRSFSRPLMIHPAQTPDEFIDTLTHELFHRLFTDNTTYESTPQLRTLWQTLYGQEHSFGCLAHIPVHAAHKAIILDVLGEPERLERELKLTQKWNKPDYVASWAYVEAGDYNDILQKFIDSYGQLPPRR